MITKRKQTNRLQFSPGNSCCRESPQLWLFPSSCW